ncbi:MAG TPA: M14 family metallopeptidase [Solirubrobacter sp.]|nr:M14 family metallopeptidase [Solirubrobacter sp.]
MRLHFDGAAAADAVQNAGIDLEHGATRVPDGIEADAVVTDSQLLKAIALGAEVVEPGEEFKWSFRTSGSQATTTAADTLLRPPAPTVRIARADYFSTKGQGFLYVEARTTLNERPNSPTAPVTMQLENDTGPGTEFESPRNMSRFVDAGEYMFHRNLFKVSTKPSRIRVTSVANGETHGVAIGNVSQWLHDVTPLTENPGYQSDFVDGYKHPQQLYARFEEIAAQNPDIAEIVTLPNKTNGYQRKAQATIGGTGQSAVVVTSRDWGHEGGNGITVEFVNRPGSDLPLEVEVNDRAVRVLLAKDSSGALASTAAQVAAALEAGAPNLIGNSHPYRNNAGTGIVQPTAEPVVLTDFLDQKRTGAPPGDPPRGPYTIRALRIGKFRDGSKPGVLIQASDHAREWVPMTVTLETAERLIANYPNDAATKDIVENVDIFLIPANNPDGANYSFYNFNNQRRNLTNYCPDNNADPGRRNSWGVDLNRNYRVGSGHDGYDGASTSCIQDTFQGPFKLSEPEAQNAIWLVENNRNIKFFMSVHSNGGQLFWQPGAYIAQGRITTPRPPMGHEAFYWQSADRILSQVRAHRQTVVTPENVGGSSDVLYSSAGNVREDLYFNYGIYAFGWEVGGSVYNPATGNFTQGSFQPAWAPGELVSGHDETMEYANGVMEMFRIASDFGKDKTGATTTLVPGDGHQSDHPIGVRFEMNEPATIYYTTDGSRPTLQSTRYKQTEFREPPETLWVEKTTTFKWFSVDAAGNVENNYDPANPATQDNYRSATITIGEDLEVGATVPPTLSLSLGAPASFGALTPGVTEDYTASTTGNVISTAGDAQISVADPSPTNTGKLVNGSFVLPTTLQAMATGGTFADVGGSANPTPLRSYAAPISNDQVTFTFKQHVDATDALRTGTYSKTLTFTLSTTQP